mmetsp:Transcript_82680/g.246573  ORF Transcript_82680/g.246573 Transcript_82680/m.246573 type:complete len:244 (+) Transcript_82680:273-1004(+)
MLASAGGSRENAEVERRALRSAEETRGEVVPTGEALAPGVLHAPHERRGWQQLLHAQGDGQRCRAVALLRSVADHPADLDRSVLRDSAECRRALLCGENREGTARPAGKIRVAAAANAQPCPCVEGLCFGRIHSALPNLLGEVLEGEADDRRGAEPAEVSVERGGLTRQRNEARQRRCLTAANDGRGLIETQEQGALGCLRTGLRMRWGRPQRGWQLRLSVLHGCVRPGTRLGGLSARLGKLD